MVAGSSVFNAGTISGGTAAIQFSGNRQHADTGAGLGLITGNAFGTGNDTFQLGGTGADTFDIGALGPAVQYQGFGTPSTSRLAARCGR